MNNQTFGQAPQMQIRPEDTEAVACNACSGEVFAATTKFRKVSKILTGTVTDQLLTMPGPFICTNCGEEIDLRKIIEDGNTKPKSSSIITEA